MIDATYTSVSLISPARQEPAQAAAAQADGLARPKATVGPAHSEADSTGEGQNSRADKQQARGIAAAPLFGPSALTTYRDQESGRVIVRLFDKDSGHVLAEFPPEKTYRPIQASDAAVQPSSQTKVDA